MRYLISILGLAVIVGAGYFTVAQYVNVAHGQSSLLTADQSSGSMSADGAQVLALLNRLQALKLDGKIFTNPNFLTLQDWSVSISPQTVGRQNPYLPTSATAANATTTASTTRVLLPRAQ